MYCVQLLPNRSQAELLRDLLFAYINSGEANSERLDDAHILYSQLTQGMAKNE